MCVCVCGEEKKAGEGGGRRTFRLAALIRQERERNHNQAMTGLAR